MEMNNLLSKYETSLSQLMEALDQEEIVIAARKKTEESQKASREQTVSPDHHSGRRVFLERTKLPTFSGKVEEWPDFSKQWKELTRGEGFPEVIALSKLRDSVPTEGKELLVGVESLELAWIKLAKHYGDRKIGILTVQKRLNSLVLTGEDYGRIEKLAREVDRAQNLLRSLGAPNQLTQDFEMVRRLVAKLPRSQQTDWDKHITSPAEVANEETDWEKFTKWLERQKEVAISAVQLQTSKLSDLPLVPLQQVVEDRQVGFQRTRPRTSYPSGVKMGAGGVGEVDILAETVTHRVQGRYGLMPWVQRQCSLVRSAAEPPIHGQRQRRSG